MIGEFERHDLVYFDSNVGATRNDPDIVTESIRENMMMNSRADTTRVAWRLGGLKAEG